MGFSPFIVDYVVPNLVIYLKIAIPLLLIACILELKTNINRIEFLYNWQWVCCIGFSAANVIFLYSLSKISNYFLLNFFITEIIFYFTLLYLQHFLNIKKIYKTKQNVKKIAKSKNSKLYVYVFFVLEVILYILKIKFLGVRSFAKQGGGTGIILRLLWVISPLSTYSIIYLCFTDGKKKTFLLLFIKAILLLFSNSRSAILSMFLSLLLFYFLNPQNMFVKSFIKKYMVKLIFLSVICGLAIIMLMSNGGSILDAILTLLYRFIAFGDVYVWAYPNDTLLKSIDQVSFTHFISADFLSTFRLLPRSYGDAINLAGNLVEYVAGPGIPEGPNSRFNIVGLAFFGFYGSLFFSILCAVILVFVHCFLVKGVNKSYKWQLYVVMIFSLLRDIQQDSNLIPQFLTEFTIFFFLMICMSFVEISCKFKVHKQIT